MAKKENVSLAQANFLGKKTRVRDAVTVLSMHGTPIKILTVVDITICYRKEALVLSNGTKWYASDGHEVGVARQGYDRSPSIRPRREGDDLLIAQTRLRTSASKLGRISWSKVDSLDILRRARDLLEDAEKHIAQKTEREKKESAAP